MGSCHSNAWGKELFMQGEGVDSEGWGVSISPWIKSYELTFFLERKRTGPSKITEKMASQGQLLSFGLALEHTHTPVLLLLLIINIVVGGILLL